MRFAIMECVVTPGGHEIDYDRILVEELQALGHKVEFYVPEGHEFKWHYGVPVHYIPGHGVSYAGAKGLKKLYLSGLREFNRQRWYKAMYMYAEEHKFDAIIFPSATYRYLRALKLSPLKNAQIPVLFLMHGLTPKECDKLNNEAANFIDLPNIRIGVQTFAAKRLTLQSPNIKVFAPPNYLPRDLKNGAGNSNSDILKLGFFGQYRKEKNLEAFLKIYEECKFSESVKLIVQGSTQTPQDAADFNRIIEKYKNYSNLEFWHRPLIGIEWQKGLASVDAIVMPYGNDRYLYHTSAILSNAIGYGKPVIIADNVNPEVLKEYNIGIAFRHDEDKSLKDAIEDFVNTYQKQKNKYQIDLRRAYQDFAPSRLAKNIVDLAQ